MKQSSGAGKGFLEELTRTGLLSAMVSNCQETIKTRLSARQMSCVRQRKWPKCHKLHTRWLVVQPQSQMVEQRIKGFVSMWETSGDQESQHRFLKSR